MKPYLIYKHQGHEPIVPRIEAVREGSSLAAALLTAAWALYHRLWILLGITIAYGLSVFTLQYYGVNGSICGFLYLLIIPYYCIYGVFWRGVGLERRGFVFTDIVIANNNDEAIFKYVTHI